MTAPLLVFGWGNASRGDDALGPLCIEALRAEFAGDPRVDFLDDYQLQVEHALDLVGRRRVLFVDASLSAEPPFTVCAVQARADTSISTHALSAAALLEVYEDLQGTPAPACKMLAIRGEQFELGAPPSAAARAHLAEALAWARHEIDQGGPIGAG